MFRYRRLSDNLQDPQRVGGDMTFGRGIHNFIVDSPTTVAQAILTRLRLWRGEWFLSLNAGVPYLQQILGHAPSANIPDSAIHNTIANTPFVRHVTDYASTFDGTSRRFSVSCKVETAFGPINQAPSGALISPSGHLVIPMMLHPSATLPEIPEPEPVEYVPVRPRALSSPQRRLPVPQRRLPPPQRRLPGPINLRPR